MTTRTQNMDLLSLIARNVIVMESSVLQESHDHVTHDHSPIWRPPQTTKNRHSPSIVEDNRDSSHRRFSYGDVTAVNGNANQVCCSLRRQSSVSDFRQVSWSEYTARRSLVKFRNRHSASYRSRDQHGSVPPSEMAVRVLCNQYEVCRSKNTKVSERVMAVFYCWFFGWITDVYNSLTHGGAESSFLKWFVSSMLVTLGATSLVGLVCLAAHGLLIAVTAVLHSAVTFVAFLGVVFLAVLGSVTIFSYSMFHNKNYRTMRAYKSMRKR